MLPTSSPLCQRWLLRSHSWRHASDGGFTPAAYDVAELPDDTTPRTFIAQHHYLGEYPSAIRRFALLDASGLAGVLILGRGNDATLTNTFPNLQPYSRSGGGESLELSRLVLLDRVPANAESWFWARCRELVARDGIRGIVTFADPLPRTRRDGSLLTPGHVGTIYQASNALYLGRSRARTLLILPDDKPLHERAMSKVRAQEKGHRATERRLLANGAPPRTAGESPAQWLTRALAAIDVQRLPHPGNHRYAWAIGRQSRAVALGALPLWPYPKRDDAPSVTSTTN